MKNKEKQIIQMYKSNYNPKLLPFLCIRVCELSQTPSLGIFCSKIHLYDMKKIEQENLFIQKYLRHGLDDSQDVIKEYKFGYEVAHVLKYRENDLEEAIFHSNFQNVNKVFWDQCLQKIKKVNEKLMNTLMQMKIKNKHILKDNSEPVKKMNLNLKEPQKQQFLLRQNAKRVKKKFDLIKQKYSLISRQNKNINVNASLKKKYNLTEERQSESQFMLQSKNLYSSKKSSALLSKQSLMKLQSMNLTSKRTSRLIIRNDSERLKKIRSSILESVPETQKRIVKKKIKKTVRVIGLKEEEKQKEQMTKNPQKIDKKIKKSLYRRRSEYEQSCTSLKNIKSSTRKIQIKSFHSMKSIKSNKSISYSMKSFLQRQRLRKLRRLNEDSDTEQLYNSRYEGNKKRKNMTKRNSIIKNSLLVKKKQEKVSIKLEKKGSYKIEGKNKNRKMSLKRRKKEENQFLNTTETNQGSPMAGQKYENVLKENRREQKRKKRGTKKKSQEEDNPKNKQLMVMKDKSTLKIRIPEYNFDSESDEEQQKSNNPFKVDVNEFRTFRQRYVRFNGNVPSLERYISNRDDENYYISNNRQFFALSMRYNLKKIDVDEDSENTRKYCLNRKMFKRQGEELKNFIAQNRHHNQLDQKDLVRETSEI